METERASQRGFLLGQSSNWRSFRHKHSPCARGRKVVQNLQSDPWHVTEIGRAFEKKEKRRGNPSKTVELGGFVFCLGLPALIFLVFLEQRCSLKNRRASTSSFPSAELSISTFPHPTQKHENFDLPLWNFVALSSASFNVMPLWSCSQPMDQTSLWSANFEWRKSVFEELDPERWTLIFPAPKDDYTGNVRHNVRKRGGEESKTIW